MTWNGAGSDWELVWNVAWIFTARFHILKKNENAKSEAFLAVITSVPLFLVVSFNEKQQRS